MQIERKLSDFNNEMNKLKDSSVMKKSLAEKKKLFMDLRKKEEERIKKERDEAEKKLNN
jgi:hypothetical protein